MIPDDYKSRKADLLKALSFKEEIFEQGTLVVVAVAANQVAAGISEVAADAFEEIIEITALMCSHPEADTAKKDFMRDVYQRAIYDNKSASRLAECIGFLGRAAACFHDHELEKAKELLFNDN